MQQNGAQTLEDQMRGHGQISLIGSATDVTLTTVVVISFVEHCSQPVKVKYSMPHWYYRYSHQILLSFCDTVTETAFFSTE